MSSDQNRISWTALTRVLVCISFVYTEVDATLKIPLRATAKEDVERLLRFVEYSVQEVKGGVSNPATADGVNISVLTG